MAKIKAVGAQSETMVAVQKGSQFFMRSPFNDFDTPLRMEGLAPDVALAALFTKWGYDPIVGPAGEKFPEMDDSEYPLLVPGKDKAGGAVWVVKEFVPQFDE